MRAVARGMILKTLPLCPERCGGAGASSIQMSEEVRRHRERHGCDKDIPEGMRSWYAIRCPRCDGSAAVGAECDVCSTEMPGYKMMRRCPASQMTSDICEALTAVSWLNDGVLPDGQSLGDQAVSFVEFKKLFDSERHEAEAEQRREG